MEAQFQIIEINESVITNIVIFSLLLINILFYYLF